MRILTYYANTTLDIVSYHPINYCQDKFMDRLTVDKIIEINCNKNTSLHIEQQERKKLKKLYDDFTNVIDTSYKLRVARKLSVFNTPIIIIENKKNQTIKEVYLYCFDKYYYLKSIDTTFITSCLDEILAAIDECFYK